MRGNAVYLFGTTLIAHGGFTWKQLLHLKTGKAMRDAMREVLDERLQAGVIKQLAIANAPTAYVDVNALDRAPEVHDKVRVLSPFDNVLIHRERLQWLFDFDYRIECCVPAAKRVYGYFCLPILCGDQFAVLKWLSGLLGLLLVRVVADIGGEGGHNVRPQVQRQPGAA